MRGTTVLAKPPGQQQIQSHISAPPEVAAAAPLCPQTPAECPPSSQESGRGREGGSGSSEGGQRRERRKGDKEKKEGERRRGVKQSRCTHLYSNMYMYMYMYRCTCMTKPVVPLVSVVLLVVQTAPAHTGRGEQTCQTSCRNRYGQ